MTVAPPAHVLQTLQDLDAMRAQIDATERTLRLLYALPETTASATPAVLARPDDDAPAPEDDDEDEAPAPAPSVLTRSTPPGTVGSKYDDGILRALKSEQAQHGLTCSDIARTFTGPGKPQEVAKIVPSIHDALKSLMKRGQVRRDGRYYHLVREGR